MTDPTPDQLTAYLEEVREAVGQRDELVTRMQTAAVSAVQFNAAQDRLAEYGPRLLAAVEAVLAEHQRGPVVILGPLCPRHENHRYFSITAVEAADVIACPECTATVRDSCAYCGPQVPLDVCPVREAISRALLGEEPGE